MFGNALGKEKRSSDQLKPLGERLFGTKAVRPDSAARADLRGDKT
jgi:hypothetical protein